jgi:hypothetical protein
MYQYYRLLEEMQDETKMLPIVLPVRYSKGKRMEGSPKRYTVTKWYTYGVPKDQE